jgi:PRTRC genetic system ThiF family protein
LKGSNTNSAHYVPQSFLSGYSPLKVVLVGAGGTGSQILSGLARMNQALLSLGAKGLSVTVVDADRIAKSNVGRQMYSMADVGKNKAVVSVTRLNMFFGTAWKALDRMVFKETDLSSWVDAGLLISAIDSGKARVEIGACAKKSGADYWMDTGNTVNTGQVILGSLGKIKQPRRSFPGRLPTVLDLYPDIAQEDGKAYQGPSCSVQEALERQDLFVNQWVATAALEILWKMFRHAGITQHGAFIDLKTMNVRPLPVNREVWRRMGWTERKIVRKKGGMR